MRQARKLLIWASCLLAASLAAGKDELPSPEIDGMLLDRTFSAAGSAFFKEFSVRWNEVASVTGYLTLAVIERPERQGGTRAWVEIEGKPIVVVPLSPGRPAPAQAAVDAALTRAMDYVAHKQEDEFAPESIEPAQLRPEVW